MPRSSIRRFPSSDVAFGVLLTAVWLLVLVEVSLGVLAPLSLVGLT